MPTQAQVVLGAIAVALLAGCEERPRASAAQPSATLASTRPAAPVSAPPAAASAEAPAAPPQSWPALTADGWGAVRIGMTEAEAVRALGGATSAGEDEGEPLGACHHLNPTSGPKGLAVMIQDGRVSRVSLYEASTVRTDRGLGQGSTEAEVRAAYGDGLEVETHAYDEEPAHYLTAWSAPGRGVRYETGVDGIVAVIHAGDESIRYIEGCS